MSATTIALNAVLGVLAFAGILTLGGWGVYRGA
jgi:hypothetical protein